MNGYDLTRRWYNFKFDNPEKVRAVHSDFYFYVVDLWNRLGQKESIGLPTTVTMQCLGIGSYNTYKKTLDDLIDFGFVILISESKNQHQSRIIALSKNDKATAKASDKALDKAHTKASDKATDTIIEQRTKNKEQGISKSHSGDKPPVEFWKEIVSIWFEFYKSKFDAEPTFNGMNGKSLKSIINRIEKLSKSKKIEWTEKTAVASFQKFLTNAWEDNWMKENFLLNNLSSKFDAIINKKAISNGKSNNNSRSGNSNQGYKPAVVDSEKLIHELTDDIANGNIPGQYS